MVPFCMPVFSLIHTLQYNLTFPLYDSSSFSSFLCSLHFFLVTMFPFFFKAWVSVILVTGLPTHLCHIDGLALPLPRTSYSCYHFHLNPIELGHIM
jgi:hypothetical protein